MTLRLGKLPATQSPNDFRLEQVVDIAAVLPAIPKTFGHEKGFALEMFGNGPDDTVRPGFEFMTSVRTSASACHSLSLSVASEK